MTKRNRLLFAAGLFVILVTLPAVIWSVYTVDRTVTSGEAYNLRVGETKDLVANRLRESGGTQGWRIAYISSPSSELRAIDVDEIQGIDLPDTGVVTLVQEEDDISLNMLRLTFSEARLTAIFRHRQLFEFP